MGQVRASEMLRAPGQPAMSAVAPDWPPCFHTWASQGHMSAKGMLGGVLASQGPSKHAIPCSAPIKSVEGQMMSVEKPD